MTSTAAARVLRQPPNVMMTQCRASLQIAVIMVLLARLVHWQPALAGVLTTVVLVPVTAAITRKAAHVRKRLVGLTDARVKVCTEVVSGALGQNPGGCGHVSCLAWGRRQIPAAIIFAALHLVFCLLNPTPLNLCWNDDT